MDIDDHLHLRSFVKPEVMRIFKWLLGALVVHFIFIIIWNSNEKIISPEMTQWTNVKLIAGFEKITEKAKAAEKKNKALIKKEVKVNKNMINKKEGVSSVKKKLTSLAKDIKALTKATTFITANSRPYKFKNPKPAYPSFARRRGMQGIVMLNVNVNEKGFVELVSIEKTSGFRVLDQSAINSVSQWQFVPAKREGEYVSSVVQIPIRFQLNDVSVN